MSVQVVNGVVGKAVGSGDTQELRRLWSRLILDKNTEILGQIARFKCLVIEGACPAAFSVAEKHLKVEASAVLDVCSFLMEQSEFDFALRLLNSILELEFKSSRECLVAARLYFRLARYKSASHILKESLRENRQNVDLLVLYSEVCKILGHISKAKAIYSEIVALAPNSYRFHYEYSRLNKAVNKDHLHHMQEVLSNSHGNDNRVVFLHYGIGKEYEDLGEFDEAFLQYSLAGEIAKKSSNYKVDADVKLMRLITSGFPLSNGNRDLVDGTIGAGEGPRPIFVLGLPRTGSTLIERALTSHSQIESIGETFFFQVALQRSSGVPAMQVPTEEGIRKCFSGDSRVVAEKYLQLTGHLRSGQNFFVDKLPENFIYIGFILASFPFAKIIYTRRSLVDTAVSIFKQPFFRYSYTVEDLCEYLSAHLKMLEQWEKLFPDRIIIVDYESLVGDSESEIKKLFSSLSIELERGCLSPEKNSSPVNTASSHQVRETINGSSINSYLNYQKHIEPLIKLGETS